MNIRLALGCLVLTAVALTAARPETAVADPETKAPDLLVVVRDQIAQARARRDAAKTPADLARALLQTGEHDEAYRLAPKLLEGSLADRVLAGRIFLAVQDFSAVDTLVARLTQEAPGDHDVRALAYRWWIVQDDLARVESTMHGHEIQANLTFTDRMAAAEVALLLLDHARADSLYAVARTFATTPEEEADAITGLARAAHRRLDFDTALARLTEAFPKSPVDADGLVDLCDVYIRLGRTEDAIAAATLAVSIGPYHDRAHYMLGNGYALKNYTQLYAAHPDNFDPGDDDMKSGDKDLAAGRLEDARRAYEKILASHPDRADVWVRLGSLDFAERLYPEARARFAGALAACPEYGRAHNGLAKTLEAERLAVEVHREAYEKRFASLPMPSVPGIETFVINWSSLTPRLQKSVALSVAPWARYLPVLIEGGLTYYIKPLHELLSETPGQDLLRDQRIGYDSRLWDDVRGCGGYHTVTGIEDVERTILDRYNTVLHELTHQVHGVLPAERQRVIQDLYRRTKERDDAAGQSFLSRYAGGSVWEYFAEGANAIGSPRRDRFDTREIVAERLDEKDPPLRTLVLETMLWSGVDSCYAPAYVGRGDEDLQRGRPRDAVASYEKALARSPREESAAAALLYALCVDGRAADAVTRAEAARQGDPASARLLVQHAEALWFAGRGIPAAVSLLEAGRGDVRETERYQVDGELGRLRWILGDAAGARKAYEDVLAYQEDSPEGLWGVAASAALAGSWDEAWKRYEEAVRLRTGVVDLRTDFARDLLRAGDVAKARTQVEEALLLDPEDPTTLALRAWIELREGKADAAERTIDAALEAAPWCDFAWIVKRTVAAARGDAKGAEKALASFRERVAAGSAPEYVYRKKWGRYDPVHTLSAVERTLAEELE